MSDEFKATPPCCEAWKAWEEEAAWYQLDDHPQVFVMPHLLHTRHRFNYCPSCGAKRRSAIRIIPLNNHEH